ncbi:hypothetical protein [Psychrosphaera algicola]|uniref:Uncharacterized protein n=1 Tax=Psychrosphaera algicola TaxID=3023714 RepID=A0ABT5FAM1_9GAMM|nr:hypothetical protein [Psychrosphaera sp. G1-22]MDC2887908.1 hypothetical protein [Psychrosphaera sp. G1-22]
MVYDASLKRYVVTQGFAAKLIDDKLNDYLYTLEHCRTVNNSNSSSAKKPLYLGVNIVHNIEFGHRAISADAFREVLNACVHSHCLNIDHRTIKSPTSEMQLIAPILLFSSINNGMSEHIVFGNYRFVILNYVIYMEHPLIIVSKILIQ